MSLSLVGWILIAVGLSVGLYAYVLYPLILLGLGRKSNHSAYTAPDEWPEITIVLPVYNEEHVIARTLDALLAVDYPSHLKHILVVSDASTDRTDEIVKSYEGRGETLTKKVA